MSSPDVRGKGTGVEIGEGFAGAGHEAAHVNTVLGRRDGPCGVAFATALATPSAGHVPFLAVLRPNLPVQPPTLFVNKAQIAGERHGVLTWGAAQAGVAAGVAAAVADGAIAAGTVGDLVCIAAVWVDPEAADEEAVFANNRQATIDALLRGAAGEPDLGQVLAQRDEPANPYFRRG